MPSWITKRPIAHRGLHGLSAGIVENCPQAFQAAIDGNYAIECDIQPTKDGEAILFHDYTLDRLTGERGAVAERTAAELKAVSFTHTRDRMITLGELFDLTDGRVPLVVEIKSRFDGDMTLTKRAVALATTYRGPLCLMSFDPAPIAWLKANAPHLPRGIVAESRYDHPEWAKVPPPVLQSMKSFSHEADTEPDFISWHIGDMPNPVTERYRKTLKKPVICWTIRTEEQRAQAALHADQVTFEGYRAE